MLVLLPYTLIAVARELQPLLHRFRIVLALTSLRALTAAPWTRGLLEREEAWWTAAESARVAGVELGAISGSWPWMFYYGAFTDYLVDVGHRTPNNSNDLWYRWRPIAPSGEGGGVGVKKINSNIGTRTLFLALACFCVWTFAASVFVLAYSSQEKTIFAWDYDNYPGKFRFLIDSLKVDGYVTTLRHVVGSLELSLIHI